MSDEQPPAGDQAPIGGSQPPTDPPPPPPVNPYETPAAPENPYGTPAPPPPPADPAAAPPPAAAPYGTPQYGTPQYAAPQPGLPGQPAQPGAYPGAPVDDSPSKGLAIAALVSSLICCTPVGFVLALIVLRKGKDGRNHGRGLAIAALVISVIFSVFLGATAYGLTQVDWDEVGDSLAPVENLATGECFTASNLTDDDEQFVDDIKEVSCSTSHDAEVLVTKELTQADAEAYDAADSTLCTDLITAGDAADKVTPAVGYFGLTTDASPNAGDKLVCVGYNLDGSKLDAPL
jgi:hypothetical protein